MNIFKQLKWLKKKYRWNKEYTKGKWEFMKSNEEHNRYLQMAKWIKDETPFKSPDILDLGCGEGFLLNFLSSEDYRQYYGVDFSENAIQKAKQSDYKNAGFEVGDLHHFQPSQTFDIIVLNEVLYYLENPVEELKRFSTYLNPDGYILLSLYKDKQELWDALCKEFKLIKQEKIIGGKDRVWDMGILKID